MPRSDARQVIATPAGFLLADDGPKSTPKSVRIVDRSYYQSTFAYLRDSADAAKTDFFTYYYIIELITAVELYKV